MKPHISYWQGTWFCRLPGWRQSRKVGYGFNPTEAFKEWDRCPVRAERMGS